MAGAQVAPATAKDSAAILELNRRTAGAPPWPEGVWAGLVEQQDSAMRARSLLLARNGEDALCGWLLGTQVGQTAELEFVLVASTMRRQGVAELLLRNWFTLLQSTGAEEILLEVRVSNEPALSLYRALGFKEQGQRKRYYTDPVEDALLMRRVL